MVEVPTFKVAILLLLVATSIAVVEIRWIWFFTGSHKIMQLKGHVTLWKGAYQDKLPSCPAWWQ